MSRSSAMGDMLALMEEKYRLLGQDTERAQKDRALQAIGINAAANLDNVKAKLMPGESAANIANTNATTGMIQKNTSWIDRLNDLALRTGAAGIGETNARAGLLGAQTLQTRELIGSSIESLLGGSPLPRFQLKTSGRGGGYRDIDMRGIRDGY